MVGALRGTIRRPPAAFSPGDDTPRDAHERPHHAKPPQVNFPFGFSEKHAPHLGKDRSSLDTALARGSGDAEMLDAISGNLPTILDAFEPSLVLYDAGADAHEVDGLGHLELSDAGMLARDTAVLRECASRSIPVATVIGGGYDRDRGRLAKRHATIFHAARAVWRQFYMTR